MHSTKAIFFVKPRTYSFDFSKAFFAEHEFWILLARRLQQAEFIQTSEEIPCLAGVKTCNSTRIRLFHIHLDPGLRTGEAGCKYHSEGRITTTLAEEINGDEDESEQACLCSQCYPLFKYTLNYTSVTAWKCFCCLNTGNIVPLKSQEALRTRAFKRQRAFFEFNHMFKHYETYPQLKKTEENGSQSQGVAPGPMKAQLLHWQSCTAMGRRARLWANPETQMPICPVPAAICSSRSVKHWPLFVTKGNSKFTDIMEGSYWRRPDRHGQNIIIKQRTQHPTTALQLHDLSRCKTGFNHLNGHLRCPSLDTLQHLNVFLVVRGPKMKTVFKVQPHQCQVQRDNHFPSPAGHTISDTSQDAVGLLGHLDTLLAHTIDQHPQVLFHQAAFQPLCPKPVALHGVVVTQMQDPALAESHTTGLGPSIQPVQPPLQSLPTLKQINTPAQLRVICKLTEGALHPLIQIIDKDMKQNWPQY
ncbi:hypothetical protein QYF61_026542 [Mycteria americana]|uniref:Uncharacterized protein n=1 Tax=Mycteria americana TaxID=33587 RepID=A0AAN7NZX0_MYCAM|nr:hypothetical protein QYF61_026542 [Mycteria americana]